MIKISSSFLIYAASALLLVAPLSLSAAEPTAIPSGIALESDAEQIALDRAELVKPAAKDFRPTAGKTVSVRLKLEKTKLRVGEPIRYSLELFNEGSEPFVVLEENPCFFKTGRLANDRVALNLTVPGGGQHPLLSPATTGQHLGGTIDFPQDLSPAQTADWLKSRNRDHKITVKLAPGETLRTRGDSPTDPFRTLRTRYTFAVPGRYELQAILDWTTPHSKPSNSVRLTLRP